MLYYWIISTIFKFAASQILIGSSIFAAFITCINPQRFYEYHEWYTKLPEIEDLKTQELGEE